MQRQNTTLNDNIRRFGGTIQGGFARQDPTQAANRRRALAEIPLNRRINAGNDREDPTAELAPNLHTLHRSLERVEVRHWWAQGGAALYS